MTRALRDGMVGAVPVCVSFLFLFFSLGALAAGQGYSLAQSLAMTAGVFASPMQAFILQAGDALTLPALVVSAVLINFRFIILSSVLAAQMRSLALWRLMLAVLTMSASSFAVVNAHRTRPGRAFYEYYLGAGLASYGTAIAATAAGTMVALQPSPAVARVVAMILPIHFTTLIGSNWPRRKPILVAAVAFVAAPLAGSLVGEKHTLVMPFVIAAAFVALDEFDAWRRGAGQERRP